MKNKDLINVLNNICPESEGEPWDNCGIQVNLHNDQVNRILVALEITSQVIDEAIDEGANFIVTHHPLIFGSVSKVDDNTVISNQLIKLINNRISVYSCHTNFDKMAGGNNDYIGQLLDLENITSFSGENKFCRKGRTKFETTFVELINLTSEAFDIDKKYFKEVGDLGKIVENIGWCSGAGSEFILEAFNEGCDAYITGDVKYHEAQLAKELGICVLDAGHYGSEKIFPENMAAILRKQLGKSNVEVIESIVDINPFIF